MSLYTRFSSQDKIQYDIKASTLLGKDHWRVIEGFRYYIRTEDSDSFVDVPAGYLTDGASVPRLFHSIVSPWGRHGQAAIVHDYLCEYLTISNRVLQNGEDVIIPVRITRKECDRIFLEAMRVLKVKPLRRRTMYSAVSLFRILARIKSPSLNIKKLKLEIEWRAENGVPEPTNGIID